VYLIEQIILEQTLNYDMKTKINNLYIKNYLNYKKFVDEISCSFNVSLEDKNKHLDKEEYGNMCNNHYQHSYELFTKFIDFYTLKDIKVCFNCTYTKYYCSNCEFNFGYEPYEYIYIYIQLWLLKIINYYIASNVF